MRCTPTTTPITIAAAPTLVRDLLGARVAHLVGAHVIAKRYLVTTDPAYRDQLSVRSVETLALQGDALADADLAALGAGSRPRRDPRAAPRRRARQGPDARASRRSTRGAATLESLAR